MPGRRNIWLFGGLLLIFIFIAPAVLQLFAWVASLITGVKPRPRGADLLLVYDDYVGADKAFQLANFLSNLLRLEVAPVPANTLKVKFRAYPCIVVATSDARKLLEKGLTPYIVEGPEGIRMLSYETTANLIAYFERIANTTVPIHLIGSATLYIVEGSSPAARVNKSVLSRINMLLLTSLSRYYGINIMDVKVVNVKWVEALGVNVSKLGLLPALVLASSWNLTQGSMTLRELKPGYYVPTRGSLRQLIDQFIGVGLVRGYEAWMEPPITTDLMSFGNSSAPVKAVVYWDLLCPHSARFEHQGFKKLLEDAKKGLVQIFFADLIVHPEAEKLHEIAHCIYEKFGAEKLIQYFDEAFAKAIAVAGNETLVKNLANELSREYNVTNCTAGVAMGDAPRLGIAGTPTVVLWGKGFDRLVFIIGAQPAKLYHEVVAWLASRE